MTYVIYPLPEIYTREKGRKIKGKRVPHTTVPAEHILDMRRMSEIERKSLHMIKKKYPQYSDSYIRNVLGYIIRANLRVK